MKRTIAILLTICLVLSLSACSSNRGSAGYYEGEIVGQDLTGNGGARIFSSKSVSLPDPDVKAKKAIKTGNEVFIYAQNDSDNYFYFMGINSSITKADVSLGNAIISLDGGTDGTAYVLTIAPDGTYILSQISASGELASKVLLFLSDLDDAVMDITVTQQGYLVQTYNNVLCYDASGTYIRELGEFTGAFDLIKNNSEIVLTIHESESTSFNVLNSNFEIESTYKVPLELTAISAGSKNGHVFAANSGIIYDVDFTTGARTGYSNEYASGEGGNFLYLTDNSYFSLANGEIKLYAVDSERSDRDIKTLTLATYAPEGETAFYDLLEAIRRFNGTSAEYRIDIVNYATYDESGGSGTGLQRLNAEILAGNTPDIYDLSYLSYQSFIRNGLLEDLYPYFDASTSISLDDFTSSAIRALEYKGSLYNLVPTYTVVTMYGPSNIANPNTWGSETFINIANSTSANLFGPKVTKAEYLRYLLVFTGNEYINIEDVSCNLVNSTFPAMLSVAAKLPDNDIGSSASDDWGLIFTGQQLFNVSNTANIAAGLCFADAAYSGNAVTLGFPSKNSGIALNPFINLGMSAQSKYKDGVWSFFEYLLSDEYQNNLPHETLPISIKALDSRLDAWITNLSKITTLVGFADNRPYEIPMNTTSANIKEKALDVINHIDCVDYVENTLFELVLREAMAFFTGGVTAEQAAENMQSKVSVFLSEQYG